MTTAMALNSIIDIIQFLDSAIVHLVPQHLFSWRQNVKCSSAMLLWVYIKEMRLFTHNQNLIIQTISILLHILKLSFLSYFLVTSDVTLSITID